LSIDCFFSQEISPEEIQIGRGHLGNLLRLSLKGRESLSRTHRHYRGYRLSGPPKGARPGIIKWASQLRGGCFHRASGFDRRQVPQSSVPGGENNQKVAKGKESLNAAGSRHWFIRGNYCKLKNQVNGNKPRGEKKGRGVLKGFRTVIGGQTLVISLRSGRGRKKYLKKEWWPIGNREWKNM